MKSRWILRLTRTGKKRKIILYAMNGRVSRRAVYREPRRMETRRRRRENMAREQQGRSAGQALAGPRRYPRNEGMQAGRQRAAGLPCASIRRPVFMRTRVVPRWISNAPASSGMRGLFCARRDASKRKGTENHVPGLQKENLLYHHAHLLPLGQHAYRPYLHHRGRRYHDPLQKAHRL